MRLILLISVIMVLIVPSALLAETKEIISEGTYNMGDGETPSVAEGRALLRAKQIALEQAGTYVESYSKVKNITLTQDEIQVLASGLMEVEILDKKRTIVGDGINFWVKIKAKVSPDKMEEMAKRVKEKSLVEDYRVIQMAYAKSQNEIDGLKKQLLKAKDGQKRGKIAKIIADDERIFSANEWFERGVRAQEEQKITHVPDGLYLFNTALVGSDHDKEYDVVVEAFTRALALNPNLVEAYYHRGEVYYFTGQYDLAVQDYKMRSKFELNNTMAYNDLGNAYYRNGEYNMAINAYSKAILLDPKMTVLYKNRGNVYAALDNIRKAVADYKKACSMGSSDDCESVRKYSDRPR